VFEPTLQTISEADEILNNLPVNNNCGNKQLIDGQPMQACSLLPKSASSEIKAKHTANKMIGR
jgi:hypothetical protein